MVEFFERLFSVHRCPGCFHRRVAAGLDDPVVSDTSGHESVRSSDLDEGLVSFITTAQDESKDCSSINWLRFSGTNLEDGWRAALNLASNGQTERWYVGVTESPVRRMLGDCLRPATMTPHNRKYHCLYPLIVTRDAAAVKKRWILDLSLIHI